MKPKKKVFVSYAHEDTKFAEKLAKELNAAGIDVSIDRSILKSGDLIHEVLLKAVLEADAFIILWSKNSKDSNYIKLELNMAFGQRANNPDYRIIAILTDETPPHVTIKPFFNIEMKHGYDSSKVKKIIDDIKKIKIAKEKSDKISITERSHGATPTKELDLSRYKNALLSLSRRIFDKDYTKSKINIRQQYYNKAYAILIKSEPDVLFAEDDSHKNHFVNRDEILRNIRNRGTRFVNIYGPSGYGKTFLLNALLSNLNLENKEEVHWISAMIDASLPGINSPESVCKELISAIDPKNEYDKYDLDSLVPTTMIWVEEERKRGSKIDQVLFLIDNLEVENTQLIAWLLGDDGPIGSNCRKIFNNYENAPEVRLIIASRREINTINYYKIPASLDKLQLNRLNASDISQLLSEKLRSRPEIEYDGFATESLAAKIFRVTGGHPRSIGYICDEIIIKFKGYKEFDSSYYLTEGVLPIILYEVLDQVELGYQYVLWILSSFHFFDLDMLIQLKRKNIILKSDDERINEMDDLIFLLNPLIDASLIMNFASGRPVYMMEPALQNVLSKWMQQEAEETYREINHIICDFFDSLFSKPMKSATATKSTSARLPNYTKDFYYFIESLYHFADFARLNEKPIQETLLEKIDIFAKFLFDRWHKYANDWVTLKTEFNDLWTKQEDLKDHIVSITGNIEIWADLTNRLNKTKSR